MMEELKENKSTMYLQKVFLFMVYILKVLDGIESTLSLRSQSQNNCSKSSQFFTSQLNRLHLKPINQLGCKRKETIRPTLRRTLTSAQYTNIQREMIDI